MQHLLNRFCTTILCILFVGTAFACPCEVSENSDFYPCEKTYVLPEQLRLIPGGIFVSLGDTWVQTEMLFTDAQGMYILNAKQPGGRCEPSEWKCDKCNTCNDFSVSICRQCRNPW